MNSGHHKEYDPEPGFDAQCGHDANERIGLLSSSPSALPVSDLQRSDDGHRLTVGAHTNGYASKHLFGSLVGGVVGGIVTCFAVQLSLSGKGSSSSCLEQTRSNGARMVNLNARGEPWAGSTYIDSYPPVSPTNYFPSFFPSDVGYLGATPTGAEPAIIATAPTQPLQTGAAALVAPAYSSLPNTSSNEDDFNIFRNWGDITPWYSVPVGTFGINEGVAPPVGCDVQGVYLLYRHGARYPSSGGGMSTLADNLHNSTDQWNATGSLAFLNDWTYKLGEEILTTFGRQQVFDLGASMRLKYGFLLDNFTAENRLPVFRTTSEDRMVASLANLALGFFGWPTEGQYEEVIMIQETGFNNSLHPSSTCQNTNNKNVSNLATPYVDEWEGIYLADALQRIQTDLHPTDGEQGFNLTIDDVYSMQQLCAYETVALGYSAFCGLFTEEEWEGFEYSIDLSYWYNSAFGSPLARVQGLGYIQELVSRLTQTPIVVYNSSTNSTWDSNPTTFPLGNAIYADASHGDVISTIITALNFTSLAASGPLPVNEIPANRSFRVSQLTPFAGNIQFQLLSCPTISGGSDDGSYMRVVINDGPVPLTGVGNCPESSSGLCPLSTFIQGQQVTTQTVDWEWGCSGNWSVPAGYVTTGGWYPPQP